MRKMKDSRIYYIGKIPSNWQIQKMGRICNVITDYVASGSFASLAENVKYLDEPDFARLIRTMDVSGKYENVKPVYINQHAYDFLKNSNLYGGEIILPNIGGVGEVYIVPKLYAKMSLAPNSIMIKTNYNDKYYYYCFLCDIGTRCLQEISGSTAQTKFNKTDLKTIKMIVPPIEEQKKIAEFLDKKVAEIDNIIEKTNETIEDYKKYKQSIITEVVTKGLDENTKMKDSGIEWIKEIPKNWEIKPLKNIVEFGKGLPITKADLVSEGNPVISYGQIHSKNNKCASIDNDLIRYVPDSFLDKKYSTNKALINDFIFADTSEDLEGVGNCVYVDRENIFAGYHTIKLHPISNKNYQYLAYLFMTDCWRSQLRSRVSGIKLFSITQKILKESTVIIPADIEMTNIVKKLNEKCTNIENIIESKQKIIEELEQYKKSLIYEYVTGKKEVKENNLLKQNDTKEIKINCKDNIFAQAILLCKIIEKLNKHNLGRVKAEKALYLIEKDIGFNFDNNYAREAAGPLSEAIYKCESVISKKNKWVKVNKVKKHIEYEILSDFNKYIKYYEKYYSDYDNQIENIINIIKNYSTDKAEMVATLYASWNDFIIKKEEISDLKIVKDVRENWNDTKKRFKENEWLEILKEMKQVGLIPKGNGNLTIIKEQ